MTRDPKRPADLVRLPANADRIARAIDDELRSHLERALARSLAGLVLGAALALALARRIHDLLFHPTVADAWTYAVAVAVVIAATLVASVAPAWRATSADPMRALRSD